MSDYALSYRLRRSRRARRIILRVDHSGAVEVVVPWYVAQRFGESFLRRRITWVKRVQVRQRAVSGMRSSLPEPVKSQVAEAYKKEAQEYFEEVVREMAGRQLGVTLPSVKIRDFRSQWGSCDKKKNQVKFSWRLLVAPPSVARYVAAHEVAHVVHANHSKKFWQTVERLDKSFKEARAWLTKHGAMLRL